MIKFLKSLRLNNKFDHFIVNNNYKRFKTDDILCYWIKIHDELNRKNPSGAATNSTAIVLIGTSIHNVILPNDLTLIHLDKLKGSMGYHDLT